MSVQGLNRDRVEAAASPVMVAMLRKRPNFAVQRNVVMGHFQPYATQQNVVLFDHLVGNAE
jgi:hypothetical protein